MVWLSTPCVNNHNWTIPSIGYKFSIEEKEQLLSTTNNLGKTIDVTPKNGEPFSDAQYKDLVEGKAVKVKEMTDKNGKTSDATLQVNDEKKDIEFINNSCGFKGRVAIVILAMYFKPYSLTFPFLST